MKHFSTFRTYIDPVEAEELLEVLQKHNIPFERSFERRDDSEGYVGSNPFDANIIFKINEEDFPRVEALINFMVADLGEHILLNRNNVNK